MSEGETQVPVPHKSSGVHKERHHKVKAKPQQQTFNPADLASNAFLCRGYKEVPTTIAIIGSYFFYKWKSRPPNAYSGYWLDARWRGQLLLVVTFITSNMLFSALRENARELDKKSGRI